MDGLKHGIKVFSENPVLGIGPGNFPYSWDRAMSSHNLYGQLLGELGAIGFAAFALLVWMIYRTHRNNRRRIDELLASRDGPAQGDEGLRLMRFLSVASVQSLILLLFNGNFGHNLYRYNWLWLGVIAIVSAHALRNRETEEAEQVPEEYVNRTYLAADEGGHADERVTTQV